jgi:hypothetical protein
MKTLRMAKILQGSSKIAALAVRASAERDQAVKDVVTLNAENVRILEENARLRDLESQANEVLRERGKAEQVHALVEVLQEFCACPPGQLEDGDECQACAAIKEHGTLIP